MKPSRRWDFLILIWYQFLLTAIFRRMERLDFKAKNKLRSVHPTSLEPLAVCVCMLFSPMVFSCQAPHFRDVAPLIPFVAPQACNYAIIGGHVEAFRVWRLMSAVISICFCLWSRQLSSAQGGQGVEPLINTHLKGWPCCNWPQVKYFVSPQNQMMIFVGFKLKMQVNQKEDTYIFFGAVSYNKPLCN